MMQQYTIGRGAECAIRINDSTQRVSRSHAILKVMDNGKIFINDSSSNGTYVNGIRITQGTDYPIRRGDSISFANVSDLNWEMIPKKSYKGVVWSIVAMILILALGAGGKFMWDKHNSSNIEPQQEVIIDSLNQDKQCDLKKKKEIEEKAQQDSIDQVKEDEKRIEAEVEARLEREKAEKKAQEKAQKNKEREEAEAKAKEQAKQDSLKRNQRVVY